MWARKRWISPVDMSSATTPRQRPSSSMIRSSAKYSMKKLVWCFTAWPYMRVQHGVAGAVGGRAGALGRALAVVGGHAAEGALVDLALVGARERHAPVLQLVDRGGRVAAQVLDRVLVAEPVRPLHGVVHVPAPVVRPHVAERRRDAALRRDGMRSGREHLGQAGGAQARLRAADGGAQARAARAHHHDVEGVVDDRISRAVDFGAAAPFPAPFWAMGELLRLAEAKGMGDAVGGRVRRHAYTRPKLIFRME